MNQSAWTLQRIGPGGRARIHLVIFQALTEGHAEHGDFGGALCSGLHAPQTAVLKIVEESTPRETSTDRIERALNALLEDQRKKDEPTTH